MPIPAPPSPSQEQRCSILQKSPNGNGMGFQQVPIEDPLNADVAPIADPFFQPLLAVVGSTAYFENATGLLICFNLRLNLLNCNGFATGHPL